MRIFGKTYSFFYEGSLQERDPSLQSNSYPYLSRSLPIFIKNIFLLTKEYFSQGRTYFIKTFNRDKALGKIIERWQEKESQAHSKEKIDPSSKLAILDSNILTLQATSPEKEFKKNSTIKKLENILQDKPDLNHFQKIGVQVALNVLTGLDSWRVYDECNLYFHCSLENPGFSSLKTDIYKNTLREIRRKAKELVHQPSYDIKKLYQEISNDFMELTRLMIQDALIHLEIPHCEYAFTALGSLARGEQTPYSDLEFVILTHRSLNEVEKLQFVKVSDWIHHQILLLGETPLIELNIKEIQNLEEIKKGFTLDGPLGKMAPSWNMDLITTSQELMQFQKTRDSPELILNCATVYGSHALTYDYLHQIAQLTHEERQKRAIHLLTRDGDRFQVFGGKVQSTGRVMNIKYEFYRAIQLRIEGLCLYYGVQERNIFERIQRLKEENIFSEGTAGKLYRVATEILKLRLQCYLAMESASEDIPLGNIDRYMSIYQQLIPLSKQVEKFTLFRSPEIFRDELDYPITLVKGILYTVLGKGSEGAVFLQKALNEARSLEWKVEIFLYLTQCMIVAYQMEKAGKYWDQAWHHFHLIDEKSHYLDLLIKMTLVRSMMFLKEDHYRESIDLMNQMIKNVSEISAVSLHPFYSVSYLRLGSIYCLRRNYIKGIETLEKALQAQSVLHTTHPRQAVIFFEIGKAYLGLENYVKAKKSLKRAFYISNKLLGSADTLVKKIHQTMSHCAYLAGSLEKEKRGDHNSHI
ncbi:MAG: tetratricopeptide repeat protein [Candidatus Rhabdochlamydia sp.]